MTSRILPALVAKHVSSAAPVGPATWIRHLFWVGVTVIATMGFTYAPSSVGASSVQRADSLRSAWHPPLRVPEELGFLSDAAGDSNELIVLVDGESEALRTLLPKGNASALSAAVRGEDAIVDAIGARDAYALSRFSFPDSARYLIGSERLDHHSRARLRKDDPEERLLRRVVLQYPDIAHARAAQQQLQVILGRDAVSMNHVLKFSSTPNDEYFANNIAANPHYQPGKEATYQWGLQAMNFPAAWGIYPGSAYVGIVGSVSWSVDYSDVDDSGNPVVLTTPAPPADLAANYRKQFSRCLSGCRPSVIQAHDTHTAGIIAATVNNRIGVAGACPNCGLAMIQAGNSDSYFAAALRGLVNRGVQVVSMSFGTAFDDPAQYSSMADAVAMANARGVLLVAAAGNYMKPAAEYPAADTRVLAVGGAQIRQADDPAAGWQPWDQHLVNLYQPGTNHPGVNGVMAPAQHIVSTFPPGVNYYSPPATPGAVGSCTDSGPTVGLDGITYLGDESGVPGDGYASCTGTSMSTPFIAALGGILRSIHPTYAEAKVRDVIRASGSNFPNCTDEVGCGLVDAARAAGAIMKIAGHRLTPLYSYYSNGRLDHFYTIVPQMGGAALRGTLQPNNACNPPPGADIQSEVSACEDNVSSYDSIKYVPVGTGLPDDYAIPGVAGAQPAAQVWVFTTPDNPKNPADPLVPLYRLSWRCGQSASPMPDVCKSTPQHMDVAYATDVQSMQALIAAGYLLDGIEGYLYSAADVQPVGTVKLLRRYNATRGDYAIFPDSLLADMQSQGYTGQSAGDNLGYAYLNNGYTPVNLDQRGITGTWYNPQTSGQGFSFQVYPDMNSAGNGLLAGSWYTFAPADTSGNTVGDASGQRWYYLDGEVDPVSPSADVKIYAGTGGRFDSPPKVPAVQVGHGTLALRDCEHGVLSYALDDGRIGTVPLTRLTANVTCAAVGDDGSAASNNLLSGFWYNRETSGQGLMVDVNPINQQFFAGWYTYAADGTGGQRWYSLQGPLTPGQKTATVQILTATGGAFNMAHPVASQVLGTAQVTFQNCFLMTINYAFDDGRRGSMTLQPTGPVAASCSLQ